MIGRRCSRLDAILPTFYPFYCHCFYSVCVCTATGNGETIMKYCPSFKIVDLMREGCGPQDACEAVVKEIVSREGGVVEMGVVALDMKVSLCLIIILKLVIKDTPLCIKRKKHLFKNALILMSQHININVLSISKQRTTFLQRTK